VRGLHPSQGGDAIEYKYRIIDGNGKFFMGVENSGGKKI